MEKNFFTSLYGIAPPVDKHIYFCNRQFSEPTLLRYASPLAWPGLYAVLVYDPSASPRPYRVIYFGQARDLSDRVTGSHEKYLSWCTAAGGSANLYVAFHWMLGSIESQRTIAERELIQHYAPECNSTHNPWGFGLR